ncbi:MAG: hypothetical protein U1G08_04975 [Verrucomicrobiota bacterium]
MKPIKLIARGLVSGQIRLTPELLSALRQLADHGDPDKTTVITITEEVTATPPPARGLRFGKLVSVVSLPPRRRCTTGPSPSPSATPDDSPAL